VASTVIEAQIPLNLARAFLCDHLPSYQLLIPSSWESYASTGRCVCFHQDILSFLIVQISPKEEKQRVATLTALPTVIDHIDVAGMSGNCWEGGYFFLRKYAAASS
jgi:hypothetical protein